MAPDKRRPKPSTDANLEAAAGLPVGYAELLDSLKTQIRTAQVRAALAANRELVLTYWRIGREILERQDAEGWGSKVIDRLSADLGRAFPTMSGLSTRNLKYMRAVAEAFADEAIVQQVVAQLPWGHNVILIDKLDALEPRLWYARQAIAHGWSRNVLVHQIEARLRERQGAAQTNFHQTLPPHQSDMARQVIKDPYVFDFLDLTDEARERDIERALTDHIRKFLLELGVGFAFVGSQYHLEVGGEDFYIDLLFYHLKLRSFVVIELKTGTFKPEYAGKLNFYLAAVDDLLRHTDDQPTIGMILCKAKNQTIVEYSLRDMNRPIGVAAYQTTPALPPLLKGVLPSVEALAIELDAAALEEPGHQ
jgi:predicted nuclease of restriction endonuclease-like (RecB) superfamily